MNKPALIIYPHQLYNHPFESYERVYLVEDPLFFTQFSFCFQKLALHRASMKSYETELLQQGVSVKYLEYSSVIESGDISKILAEDAVSHCSMVEFDDDWLERRVRKGLEQSGINLTVIRSPGFLTDLSWSRDFFDQKQRFFFTDFYVAQRKRLGILIDHKGPIGGKWSFDHENRKKLPKDLVPPLLNHPDQTEITKEACAYVTKHFPSAPGIHGQLLYPHSRTQAREWLTHFIDERLGLFGDFEDAILTSGGTLYHSVLTPMLNIGLLTPSEIIEAVLKSRQVNLNSLEGFIRQIIGWREFMRAMYHIQGRRQRTSNFFKNERSMPKALYDGTTGIAPVDTVIRSVLASGYCHHIERLMVLGNFMLLCNIKPTAVYQWFMELFVDSYDWVMVPNVYAMSQFADKGMITTKPYISGSNYIIKMSNYKKGAWCETWDALYWTHIAKHKAFYASNPRMSVMASMVDRLGDKMVLHQKNAERFINSIF